MEEDQGKAIEEVMRGCEFAEELRQVLLFNNFYFLRKHVYNISLIIRVLIQLSISK